MNALAFSVSMEKVFINEVEKCTLAQAEMEKRHEMLVKAVDDIQLVKEVGSSSLKNSSSKSPSPSIAISDEKKTNKKAYGT